VKKAREQDQQGALVAAKNGALGASRGDDGPLAQKRVLGDQLGARTGEIGDYATRDRRAACAAERVRKLVGEPGSSCGELAEDAEHRPIRANLTKIIKSCSARDPARSCGGGGK